MLFPNGLKSLLNKTERFTNNYTNVAFHKNHSRWLAILLKQVQVLHLCQTTKSLKPLTLITTNSRVDLEKLHFWTKALQFLLKIDVAKNLLARLLDLMAELLNLLIILTKTKKHYLNTLFMSMLSIRQTKSKLPSNSTWVTTNLLIVMPIISIPKKVVLTLKDLSHHLQR